MIAYGTSLGQTSLTWQNWHYWCYKKRKRKTQKKESQKESTFGDWIWKTLKNIGEKLHVSGEADSKTRGIDEEITIKVYENKYILGYTILKYLLGFKGFKVES